MKELTIPERYNYIAVFLTLACNLKCPFCINDFSDKTEGYSLIPADKWIEGLNRIVSRPDLPVTLQGGEPSLHPGFIDIINGLRPDLNIDILTNLQFDVDEFMEAVSPSRVHRDAPYASIRASYHPRQMDYEELKAKVLKLLENDYSVGIWAVQHPGMLAEIEWAREDAVNAGIDFRVKDFLGYHDGQRHGVYKYEEALSGEASSVECRTSELIIGPSGDVFRCHADLYQGRAVIGHICDELFDIEDVFRQCGCFGLCNPCDVKTKTNRYQEFGHTSVEIEWEKS
ncbi:MAG: radical SAM protein [Kiritimatiellia bacterium]|nr:radical SAM protein [Kiritimatiellia bacterium]MDP6848070.1 radical SAM protein [Kiritimatiellia bacterium]